MSPGFFAPRHCSICGGDISDLDCEHEPGRMYSKVAAREADDSCTVCGVVDCLNHVPGSAYATMAHATVREADLDEISIVPRPRDPLARLDGVELPAEAVATLPGSDRPDTVLQCHRCISPCTGFTSAEEALALTLPCCGAVHARQSQSGDQLQATYIVEDRIVGDERNAESNGSCRDPAICLVVFLAEPMTVLDAPCAQRGIDVDESWPRPNDLGSRDFVVEPPEPPAAPASQLRAIAKLSDRDERDDGGAAFEYWRVLGA